MFLVSGEELVSMFQKILVKYFPVFTKNYTFCIALNIQVKTLLCKYKHLTYILPIKEIIASVKVEFEGLLNAILLKFQLMTFRIIQICRIDRFLMKLLLYI